jgi:ferredoxin
MADKNSRLLQNVPGPWYVDSNCIDCDLCRETAPSVFRRDEDNGNSVVFHQPESEEELRLAEEARSGCPVEAIGNDGPSEQAVPNHTPSGVEIVQGSTER